MCVDSLTAVCSKQGISSCYAVPETRGKEEGTGTFWEGGMMSNNRPRRVQSLQSICCCCPCRQGRSTAGAAGHLRSRQDTQPAMLSRQLGLYTPACRM